MDRSPDPHSGLPRWDRLQAIGPLPTRRRPRRRLPLAIAAIVVLVAVGLAVAAVAGYPTRL